MKKLNQFLVLVLLSSLMLASCEKEAPIIINEEELITTVIYTLIPDGGGDSVEMRFTDLDGDGGDDPTLVSGNLAANQSYSGTLQLLNESVSPADNITQEVNEEDEDHQVFFESTVSNLSISYTDQDADGNPVGLSTMITTGDAASGTLTITLRHEPNKSATGVASGDINNAGGETDIEVTFTLDVL